MKKLALLLSVVLLAGCSVFTPKTSVENLAKGEMYYKTGDYKKALKYLNKAVTKDPYNLDAYASRGALLFEVDDYDAAIADFNIIMQANPNRSEVYSAIGAALAAQGKYDEAIKVLAQALALNPANVEALCSMGGIYYSKGEYKNAVEEYTKALQYRKAPQIYLMRGLSYDQAGMTKEARADLEFAGFEVVEATEAAPAKEEVKADVKTTQPAAAVKPAAAAPVKK